MSGCIVSALVTSVNLQNQRLVRGEKIAAGLWRLTCLSLMMLKCPLEGLETVQTAGGISYSHVSLHDLDLETNDGSYYLICCVLQSYLDGSHIDAPTQLPPHPNNTTPSPSPSHDFNATSDWMKHQYRSNLQVS